MLKPSVGTDRIAGRRCAVEAMTTGPEGGDGGHDVAVIEAADPRTVDPARLRACRTHRPGDGSVRRLVGAAIDAMSDADCAEF